jgi:RHS repeat-associated protein
MSAMRLFRIAALLLASLCCSNIGAQIIAAGPTLPDSKVVSPGGVDMRSGVFAASTPTLSIGPGEKGGFVFFRMADKITSYTSNWGYWLSKRAGASGGWFASVANASIGETYYSGLAAGPYTQASLVRDGLSKLEIFTSGANKYAVHTSADGVTTRFQTTSTGFDAGAEEIKYPSGDTYWFTYDSGGTGGNTRLRRISSNTGYQLIFEYYASPDNGKTSKICAINAAFTTPPVSAVCPIGARSVSYTYSGTRIATATDPGGGVWTSTSNYVNLTTPFSESFYKPGYAQPWLTNTYTKDPSFNLTLGISQQTFGDGKAISYDFDNVGFGEFGTGTVFLVLSWTENAVNTTSIGWKTLQTNANYPPAVAGPGTITDPLGRQTKATYDAQFVKTLSTADPSGLKSTYSYNSNISITQVQQTPSTGYSDPAITTSYTYDCTVALNCKKPATSTDARGNVTNYTYDPVHGGTLTVTDPAPGPGSSAYETTRPQTRYTWSQYYAWYRNTSGALVQATTPVWRVSASSQCRTLAACAGTADEIKTTFVYGSAGSPNNLNLTQQTTSSGDGALSATTSFGYDADGNLVSVDGPLPGASDTQVWKFDAMRRPVGAIGPDPDGAGPLLNRARKSTYDGDGRRTKIEEGTTTGQSDADFALFSPLESMEAEYDIMDRPTKIVTKGGSATFGVTQYSYDAFGRRECVAVRMNPAAFSSLPSSACTLGPEGPNGPDRISKNFYDAAGQLTKTQGALGTVDVSDDQTITYTSNGKTATIADGESNLTTFEYDGHDRLKKIRYPVSTPGQLTSSTTDFEQFAYDENGNNLQRVGRDGQQIAFSYDRLNRMTQRVLPSPETSISYTPYDLQDHSLTISQGPKTLSFGWDALGRQRSATGVGGTMLFDYDAAGQRTKTTWPDGFFVTQDFYTTGEVQAIREYGATSGVGVLATYSYDNGGNRVAINRGNGTSTTFAPNGISLLSSLSHYFVSTPNNVSTSFSYNAASQIISQTRTNDSYAWTGHYNTNRTYGVNGLNLATSDGATSLAYADGRGNITAIGASAFGYSSENHLISGPSGATFDYDPVGRLLQSSKAGLTTRFAYDGVKLVAEYDAANVLQRRYVHGPGVDEPLVWYEGSGTADRRWIHQDERGSVVAHSNSAGAAIQSNSYDEYGVPQAGNLGRFGYTGQMWIPEASLYYFKARMYSPSLGRFMQNDPSLYEDGLNLSAYVHGDPVNFIDPSGEGAKGKAVAYAVKLSGQQMKVLGKVSMKQAIRLRKMGENILAKSKRIAKKIETQAHGTDKLKKHTPHPSAGADARPHFQTDGVQGHTFWSAVGATLLVAAADALDNTAEAAEAAGNAVEGVSDEVGDFMDEYAWTPLDVLQEHFQRQPPAFRKKDPADPRDKEWWRFVPVCINCRRGHVEVEPQ